MIFVTLIYNIIFIPLAKFIILLVKPFNKKLKERENSWKNTLELLHNFNAQSNKEFPRIWFHSASMGEFEQAKPIIEEIKTRNPNIQIIVSFYSPSGYNNQKNYRYADIVLYMPLDSRRRAKIFINTIKPALAVFVRYELWYNHLSLLKKLNIPVYLICATAPGSRILRNCKIPRIFTKANFSLFDKIFTAGTIHTDFINTLKIKSEILSLTDTRFDRIVQKVEQGKNDSILPKELFENDDFVLIAGSTWEKDEDIIIKSIRKIEKENVYRIRLIIVPHEPTESHLERLKELVPNSFYLSSVLNFLKDDIPKNDIKTFLGRNHIIVDSIGKLLQLYVIADAAYIGGAFGAGVHSVSEPAGYAIPLASGPSMDNSPDAVELRRLGALTVINKTYEFHEWLLELIENKELRRKSGEIAGEYVRKSVGSSLIIVESIMKKIK